MRYIEMSANDPQYKDFIKYCNTLRCPLCGSQLDGNISNKLAALYCVSNNSEYQLQLHSNEEDPFWEEINYYYSQFQYEITSVKLGAKDQYRTLINRLNMDAHPDHRYKTREKIFEFTGKKLLFFRSRMEEKVFLKKLKTYTLFS
jgi:hypothetical protein